MGTLERINTSALRDLVESFRDVVKAHAGALNRLNVYPVPDGDTGTNMARTLDAVVNALESADPDDLAATCDAISHGSLMGARGNSGVILSQIMRGIASTLKTSVDGADARTVAAALQAASDGAYQAVLKPIEGTILTVVRESAAAAVEAAEGGSTLLEMARAAHAAGQTSLANTPELLPVLKDAGVVDAGGAGFLLLLDSLLYVVNGVDLPEPETDDGSGGAVAAAFDTPAVATPRSSSRKVGGADEVDVADQRYEVMFFMDLEDAQIDAFKQGWGAIGDSIVVVGGDGIWNCHVHTNDVGAAIEVALDLDGRPKQIRVSDLFEEVDVEHAQREAAMTGSDASTVAPLPRHAAAGAGLPPVTTAVVGVCTGDGMVELFAQLGVQGVVTGGQTMNPSTAELLDTVEHVNADQVIILPNNKNIIPVAEQIDALTTKSVVVVPTISMAEGLAALIVYDPEASSEANGAGMVEAANSVTTGEITQAVRDTMTDIGQVTEGDWIGIVKGDGIMASEAGIFDAIVKLLDVILGDEAELITVITGEDADTAVTDSITGWLGDHHAAVGVEVHVGGQPLYPYLFGVE